MSVQRVRTALRGFYAVLDRDDEALLRALALEARVLQVRIKPRGKPVDAGEIVRVARMARRYCDAAGIALIVNDRIDIALAVGADGVHLGQTDLPIAEARAIAGDRLWIGVSTHALDQVREACEAGADYIGFGPVFETSTKEHPDRVQGLEGLHSAVAAATVPVVAIGGVTAELASSVYATGAQAICAIAAVNDAPDVVAAARAMAGDAKRLLRT